MNYHQAFKTEMFKHLREDFEDSFTPGGAPKHKSKKPIMIPMSYYREKSKIVMDTLSRKGLKKPQGFEYLNLVDEIFSEHETHSIEDVQSMVDDGMMANPSTTKIPDYMYDEFFEKYFGADSLRSNPIKSVPPEELMRQFKSTLQHMSGLMLRQSMRIANEDYQFTENMSLEDQKKAVDNQYRRAFVSMVIAGMMKRVYLMKPTDIDEFIKVVGWKDKSLSSLKLTATRKLFSRGVTQVIDQMFGNQDLGKAILAQVRRMGGQKDVK